MSKCFACCEIFHGFWCLLILFSKLIKWLIYLGVGVSTHLCLTLCLLGNFVIFFCCLLIFSKSAWSGPTFGRAWSGTKLFASRLSADNTSRQRVNNQLITLLNIWYISCESSALCHSKNHMKHQTLFMTVLLHLFVYTLKINTCPIIRLETSYLHKIYITPPKQQSRLVLVNNTFIQPSLLQKVYHKVENRGFFIFTWFSHLLIGFESIKTVSELWVPQKPFSLWYTQYGQPYAWL